MIHVVKKYSISITLFGIVIVRKLRQYQKAPNRIFSNELGNRIVCNCLHITKAKSSISVTVFGNDTEVNYSQYANIPIGITDTLSGIVIEDKLEQFQNISPKLEKLTVFGRRTVLSLVQSRKQL